MTRKRKKQKEERAKRKSSGTEQDRVNDKQHQDIKDLFHIETGPQLPEARRFSFFPERGEKKEQGEKRQYRSGEEGDEADARLGEGTEPVFQGPEGSHRPPDETDNAGKSVRIAHGIIFISVRIVIPAKAGIQS